MQYFLCLHCGHQSNFVLQCGLDVVSVEGDLPLIVTALYMHLCFMLLYLCLHLYLVLM